MGVLDGKVALITGSSRGIGAAIAERFARDGAKVVVNYSKSEDAAKELVARIEKAGGTAVAVGGDVAQPSEIPEIFAGVKKAYGKLDIFVNNAGVMDRAEIEKVDAAHFNKHFDINVRGLLLCTVEAIKMLPKGGKILFVSSNITRMAIPGSVVYSATKGAIDVITQVLAAELGPKGITVNAISPGYTETDMTEVMDHSEVKQSVQMTALGRAGKPEDIADAAVFLVSDDARWVTGEKLGVSGGLRG